MIRYKYGKKTGHLVTWAMRPSKSPPMHCTHTKVQGTPKRGFYTNTPINSIITISFTDDIIEFNSDCVAAIRITMSDQGVGIPEEELSSIFDKFYQSTRTKTGAGGTGLGLSICIDICQYHHGKLWAENIVGPEQGAKFTLLIPKVYLEKIL